MTNALQIDNIWKKYKDFALQDISLSVPQGRVVGLIGENGSGKSTTIRCIIGQSVPDQGTVSVYGRNALTDLQTHQIIGCAIEPKCFPEIFDARMVSAVMKDIFTEWDAPYFFGFLEKFNVPLDRKIKNMSKGMQVKLVLAAAISHGAKLLLLDEATAGLDPVVREEILELLQEFMEDPQHAILITSHITSDIEQIADSVLFIRDGRILFEVEKNELENYGIAQLRKEEIDLVDSALILAMRKLPMHTEALISDRSQFALRYPDYALSPASLDDVIVLLSKGEHS